MIKMHILVPYKIVNFLRFLITNMFWNCHRACPILSPPNPRFKGLKSFKKNSVLTFRCHLSSATKESPNITLVNTDFGAGWQISFFHQFDGTESKTEAHFYAKSQVFSVHKITIFLQIEFFPLFWLDVTILFALKHARIGSLLKVNFLYNEWCWIKSFDIKSVIQNFLENRKQLASNYRQLIEEIIQYYTRMVPIWV